MLALFPPSTMKVYVCPLCTTSSGTSVSLMYQDIPQPGWPKECWGSFCGREKGSNCSPPVMAMYPLSAPEGPMRATNVLFSSATILVAPNGLQAVQVRLVWHVEEVLRAKGDIVAAEEKGGGERILWSYLSEVILCSH